MLTACRRNIFWVCGNCGTHDLTAAGQDWDHHFVMDGWESMKPYPSLRDYLHSAVVVGGGIMVLRGMTIDELPLLQ